MKIETRLNISDKIFFINDKKVICSKVQRIVIEVRGGIEIEIIYLCNTEKDKQINIKVEEKYAFKSKEELVSSL